MKRVFDIGGALFAMTLLCVPMLMIALLVATTSRGPILYWSDRIGRNNKIFRMPKFRTMRTNTPEVATHLLHDSERWVTPLGRFLRKTSLDELPQLWSILIGRMSFVGPRPALHNQSELIRLRTNNGVHLLRPGLTGWAQINGRDELPIEGKVELDTYYFENQSLWFDCRIVFQTFFKVLVREGVVQADELNPLRVTEDNSIRRVA